MQRVATRGHSPYDGYRSRGATAAVTGEGAPNAQLPVLEREKKIQTKTPHKMPSRKVTSHVWTVAASRAPFPTITQMNDLPRLFLFLPTSLVAYRRSSFPIGFARQLSKWPSGRRRPRRGRTVVGPPRSFFSNAPPLKRTFFCFSLDHTPVCLALCRFARSFQSVFILYGKKKKWPSLLRMCGFRCQIPFLIPSQGCWWISSMTTSTSSSCAAP